MHAAPDKNGRHSDAEGDELMDSLAWVRAAGAAAALMACGGDTTPTGADGSTGADPTMDPATDSGEDDGSSGDTGEPDACLDPGVAAQPLRRLTRAQYRNIARDVLGLVVDVESLDDDEKAGPFDSNSSAPVSNVTVEQYRLLAESLATAAMDRVDELVACNPAEQGCDATFIRDIGRLLYRRTLTQAEVATYLGLFARGDDFPNGARLVLQAMLQSPVFLYQLELSLPDAGEGVVELERPELASRLSFFLWNSGPDRALLDAADAGELDSADGLRTHAERLLADTRAREAIANFHLQWLAVDDLPTLLKDEAVYPQFDEELRAAMADEARRFAQVVILQGDGKLETLLTAPYSYIDGPLFGLYGVAEPGGHDPGQRVDLDPTKRAGVLTQAAFLATHAHANQSGPIQRGAAIRTNFLCDPPPPPPPTANAVPPSPDPDATTRELFEAHTENPECAACHVLIDGIGLGFEGYDGVGAYREQENGLAVDQSGELVGTDDIDGEFDGVVELAAELAKSQQVRECVARQWFRYAFGRIEGDGDACSLDVLDTAFADSDGDIRELLIGIVQTDAFRHRLVE
jgi:hypothetical protein